MHGNFVFVWGGGAHKYAYGSLIGLGWLTGQWPQESHLPVCLLSTAITSGHHWACLLLFFFFFIMGSGIELRSPCVVEKLLWELIQPMVSEVLAP